MLKPNPDATPPTGPSCRPLIPSSRTTATVGKPGYLARLVRLPNEAREDAKVTEPTVPIEELVARAAEIEQDMSLFDDSASGVSARDAALVSTRERFFEVLMRALADGRLNEDHVVDGKGEDVRLTPAGAQVAHELFGQIRYTEGGGYYRRSSILLARELVQAAARRRRGFFTVSEVVATVCEQSPHVRSDELRVFIIAEINSQRLALRNPATEMPFADSGGAKHLIGLLRAHDVIALFRSEGVSYTLPEQWGNELCAEDGNDVLFNQPTTSAAAHEPATATQVAAIFPVLPAPRENVKWWKERLAVPDRYGLASCRAIQGKPGIGATWRVLEIAGWLTDSRAGRKPHLSVKQVRAALMAMPEYASEADLRFPEEDDLPH